MSELPAVYHTPANRTPAEEYPLSYVLAYCQLRSGNLILQAARQHLNELFARAAAAEAQVADMARNIAGASRLVDVANATVAESTCTIAEASGQLAEAQARVAVQALTIRALKAEARVKNQQAELGEQEVAMLRLIQENTTRII